MKYEVASKFSEDELVHAHNNVFVDYEGVGVLSLEMFQAINVQRGVKYEYSVVAMDKDKIVGLILNAIRMYKGVKTGYDCGTGVIPEMRGKGIAKAMFEEVRKILISVSCFKYVLEVIQTNEKALNLYKNQGFEIVREFDCLGGKREGIEENLPKVNIEDAKFSLHNQSDYDWERIIQFQQFPPSWQNSNESMKHSLRHKVLELASEDELEGYLVFNPQSGEIGQIGARNIFETGKKLISYLLTQNPDIQQVYHINVDTENTALLDLYNALQFQSFTKQFEMILNF